MNWKTMNHIVIIDDDLSSFDSFAGYVHCPFFDSLERSS